MHIVYKQTITVCRCVCSNKTCTVYTNKPLHCVDVCVVIKHAHCIQTNIAHVSDACNQYLFKRIVCLFSERIGVKIRNKKQNKKYLYKKKKMNDVDWIEIIF